MLSKDEITALTVCPACNKKFSDRASNGSKVNHLVNCKKFSWDTQQGGQAPPPNPPPSESQDAPFTCGGCGAGLDQKYAHCPSCGVALGDPIAQY